MTRRPATLTMTDLLEEFESEGLEQLRRAYLRLMEADGPTEPWANFADRISDLLGERE